jgi:hypothetical protein
MQGLGFGLPVVERPCDANGDGHRMSELEANRHQLEAGDSAIVMVCVVFHSGTFRFAQRSPNGGRRDVSLSLSLRRNETGQRWLEARRNGWGCTPVWHSFQLVVHLLGIAIPLGLTALIVFMIVFISYGS